MVAYTANPGQLSLFGGDRCMARGLTAAFALATFDVDAEFSRYKPRDYTNIFTK
jgi:hypothetical protein